MQLLKPVYYIADRISAGTGIYTTGQCRRIATQVGKDIADMQISDNSKLKQAAMDIVHRYAPKADFDLNINEEPTDTSQRRLGSYDFIENRIDVNSYNFSERGVTFPSIFSHEFFHYMSHNHTKTKISERTKNTRKWYKSQPKEKIERHEKEIKDKSDFITTLFNMTKIEPQYRIKDRKDMLQYFSGERYTGLSSRKRFNAYITGISRHFARPDNPKSTNFFRAWIPYTKDEINAYKVSEAVGKYTNDIAESNESHNRTVLLKEAVKILQREKRKTASKGSLINKLRYFLAYKFNKPKFERMCAKIRYSERGLPTSAVNL